MTDEYKAKRAAKHAKQPQSELVKGLQAARGFGLAVASAQYANGTVCAFYMVTKAEPYINDSTMVTGWSEGKFVLGIVQNLPDVSTLDNLAGSMTNQFPIELKRGRLSFRENELPRVITDEWLQELGRKIAYDLA